jgi:hypothetical protein
MQFASEFRLVTVMKSIIFSADFSLCCLVWNMNVAKIPHESVHFQIEKQEEKPSYWTQGISHALFLIKKIY